MRLVNVSKVPEDVFMVIRVVTLFRGMMAAFACYVSAAAVWEPFARMALKKHGVFCPIPEGAVFTNNPLHGGHGGQQQEEGGGGPVYRRVGSIFRDMKVVAEWMKARGLPHSRQSLTPMAVHDVTTIYKLARLSMEEDPILDSALARFTCEEQRRAKDLAVKQEKEAIIKSKAKAKEQERQIKEAALSEIAAAQGEKQKPKRNFRSKLAGFFLRSI